MNDSKSPPLVLIALGLLVLLATSYIGAYSLNVYRRGYFAAGNVSNVGYRVGGKWSETAFAPIHALDRRLRHDYWSPPADFDQLIYLIQTTVEPTTGWNEDALSVKRD